MPQNFTYTSAPNPYAQSIAQLLEQHGEIQAQRAQQVGNIWGKTIADVGQNIAGTIQKENAPETKMAQLQLDEAQRVNQARIVTTAALQNPANWNPDGTVNDEKVGATLKKQNIDAWQQWTSQAAAKQQAQASLAKTLNDIQLSDISIEEKQRAAQQAKSEAVGKLAYSALSNLQQKADDPLHARDAAMAAIAHAATIPALGIDPKTANQIVLQLAQSSAPEIAGTLAQLIPPDLKAKLDQESAAASKANAEAENLRKFGSATPPHLQTEDQWLLSGKQTPILFNPVTGWRGTIVGGPDVSAQLVKAPTQATGNQSEQREDAKAVAQGIKDGTTSPEVLLSARTTAQGMALQAELKKIGVNARQLTSDWLATKTAIRSLNSAQQVRLTEGIQKASASLDRVESLNNELEGMLDRYGIKAFNRAQLTAAVNGGYGPKAASVATRLQAQLADVTGELGTVIMGGNSPTDHGLDLASKNLSSDWTHDVLKDGIAQARYNLGLANNARNDFLEKLGVGSTTMQLPAAGASEQAPPARGTGAGPGGQQPTGFLDTLRQRATTPPATGRAGGG